jgi:hypothetical protein
MTPIRQSFAVANSIESERIGRGSENSNKTRLLATTKLNKLALVIPN